MNQLREKRKELGLTQKQVAKACGVSRRTYQTYEENNITNDTFDELIKRINEMCLEKSPNRILGIKFIKETCQKIFVKYTNVSCAYLYGSYARGEATGKSDVDILVICHDMGLEFFQMAAELSDSLNKEVDLQTLEQMVGSETIMENILKEGVKIYTDNKVSLTSRIDVILKHIEEVQKDVQGKTLDEFKESDLFVRATCFSIAQIGENMSKLEEKIGEKYPDIPWRKAKDMRNIIVHVYNKVKAEVVYNTAIKNMDELKQSLLKIKSDLNI